MFKKLLLSTITAIFCIANIFAQGLDFTANPTSGSVPLLVTFTNTSTNPSAYKYIWYFGDGVIVTDYNTTTITHTYNVAGNYTPQFDAYDSSNVLINFSNGSSGNINVLNTLSVSVSSSNVYCFNACDGTANAIVSGGVGPYSYSWVPGNITTANASGLCMGTYTVTVTDYNMAQSTTTVTITEPTPLSVTTSFVNSSCFGLSNGSATATVTGGTPTGGSPGYSFYWAPVGVFDPSITNLSAGNYSVLVTDANGCTTSDSLIITEPSTVLSVSTTTTPANCGMSDGSATINANGGTQPFTYLWNNSQISQTISALTAGNYSCTVTDANGCTQLANASIPNTNGPTVTISSQTNVGCFGGTDGTAVVSATGGTAPYTYLWSNNSTTTNVSNLAAGNYTVTVTDNNGCLNSTTVTITQPTLLSVTTTTNSSVCSGQSAFLACNPVGGAGGGYFISWSPSAGVICSTCPSTNADPVSTTTYTVTITDTNSCSTFATQTITVNPLPNVVANTSAAAVCSGNPVTLTGSGAISYTWLGGVIDGTGFIPASTSNYVVTGTDTNACIASDTVFVTVNPSPAVNAGSDQNVCIGALATYTGSAPGATTYFWDFGDGGTSSILNPSHAYSIAGTFLVTFTGSTISGCGATDTLLITVSSAITPITGFSYNTPVCANGTNPVPIPVTNFTTGGAYSSTAGLVINLSTGIIDLSVSTPGTYTITYSTAAFGCTSANSSTTSITINPLPATPITGNNSPICEGSPLNLTSNTIPGATYSWTGPNGFTSSVEDPTVSISATTSMAGTYSVIVTIAGCSSLPGTTVTSVNPLPLITVTPLSQSICTGTNVQLTALGASTYLWSPLTGLSCSSCSNPVASVNSTTTYTVQGTDGNSCTANATATISLIPNTDVYGHVDSAGFSFLNGEVVLYKQLPAQIQFDTLQVVSINASGDYHFTNIDYGTYLIKVFPDTAMHPTAMPTYFGNQFLWTAADSINHDCYANDTANISLQFIAALPQGSGALGGVIEEGVGFGRQEGDPIPGLDVKLGKNPGGATNIVASTQTDANGYYSFDNLALNSVVGGSYIILADIPGLGMSSSYTIVLDPTHLSYDSLNYAVDSSNIYTVPTSSTGINNSLSDASSHFAIYPNPFKANTNIEYSLSTEANVTLEVYNVLGVKIRSMINSKQSAGNHKCYLNNQSDQLSSGVYFITLTIDGKASTQRIAVME